jgi:hypothetical protein
VVPYCARLQPFASLNPESHSCRAPNVQLLSGRQFESFFFSFDSVVHQDRWNALVSCELREFSKDRPLVH